jgi:hypothetical protein
MNDDHLSHLVRALDTAVESSPAGIAQGLLSSDLEYAALRLRCLTERLGPLAEESPYLAFLRRTTRAAEAAMPRIAISA